MEDKIKILKLAKAKAREQLGHLTGIEGFGIGDGCVRVYVRDNEAAKRIPGKIQGVTLVPVVSGVIHALSN